MSVLLASVRHALIGSHLVLGQTPPRAVPSPQRRHCYMNDHRFLLAGAAATNRSCRRIAFQIVTRP
jgi:hypothetical protein